MNYEVYGEYRDSKLTWLGNIPNDWEIERLGYHSTIITGHPFNSDLFSTEGIPLIRIRDLKEEDTTLFWNNDYPSYAIINNGDLLVGMDGDFDVVSWKGKKALLNQRIFKINAKNKLLDNYLKYILQIPITHINKLTMSTTVKHLSVKDVNDIKIPLPSKNEQKQIANYLDKKTSKIDTTIAKNKELIQLLEEKRAALINQVVTKGLNPEVPMKDSGIEWIGKIPKHWEIIFLKRFIKSISSGKTPNHEKNGKYPLYGSTGIIGSTDNAPYNGRYILIARVGANAGKTNIAEGKIGVTDNTLIINYTSKINHKFLFYILSIYDFKIITIGSGQPLITGNDVKNIKITIPNLEEQTQIVEFLDKEISNINKTIDKIKDNIKLLEEYKTSLIHHVVTGKIDVRGEKI